MNNERKHLKIVYLVNNDHNTHANQINYTQNKNSFLAPYISAPNAIPNFFYINRNNLNKFFAI